MVFAEALLLLEELLRFFAGAEALPRDRAEHVTDRRGSSWMTQDSNVARSTN
jgi:hypothetical protein